MLARYQDRIYGIAFRPVPGPHITIDFDLGDLIECKGQIYTAAPQQ